MRVSVVVTNHNYERFLAEAIDSALAQTHPDAEVVVVDDGSTDGSLAVLERYGDRLTAVLQANAGQGSAVNAGFAASTGDAVVFLDADDTLSPGATTVISALMDSARTVKVHWPLWVVDAEGRRSGQLYPAEHLPSGDLRTRLLSTPDYLTPPQSGNAYARAYLERVLPMPEAPFGTGADNFLFLLAPVFGEIRAATQPLGTYRRHGANNYAGHTFERRMAQVRAWTEASYAALEEHCRREGVRADPAAWRREAWVFRVTAAVERLRELIPAGVPFVLIDADDWALRGDDRWKPIPFLERDGDFWGPPADDAAAIAELERQRAAGARFVAVAFAAFWWLDHYAGMRAHLEAAARVVSEDENVIVFAWEGE